MNMKESMMKSQVFVCTQMNKLVLLIPLFFITMCGEAPVTPPAHACSPRLDGKSTECPPFDDFCLRSKWPDECNPKPTLPREEMRGDIDVWNPHHLIQMEQMFIRNARRTQIEKNMTLPSDAINNALDDFWEVQNGSNGSTESEELL